MRKRFIAYLFLLLFSLPALADQLIIEPDMGRKPIIEALTGAKNSLELVMYGFTDPELLTPFIEKNQAGKTVKIILEGSPYKADDENSKTIAAFTQQHISWQGHIPPFRLIHQKTLIIDGKKAMIMTFNFTKSTFKNERNFALVIDDPKQVNAVNALFSADWNHIPYSNTQPDLVISPDDSRNKLIALVQQAKQSLKIYAQQLNDYKIIGELARAAKRGVNIQILTSTPLRENQQRYLTRAGVTLHNSQILKIHAKVMIIDQRMAVLGSINFTRPSLDDNRELSVITRDPVVLEQLVNTFNQDWGNEKTTAKKQKKEKKDWLKQITDKRVMKRELHKLQRMIQKLQREN